jgi:hypothetical protein
VSGFTTIVAVLADPSGSGKSYTLGEPVYPFSVSTTSTTMATIRRCPLAIETRPEP